MNLKLTGRLVSQAYFNMTYEIFLVVFPQNKVPAHWSMWILEPDGAVEGKIIHAIGSPFHGYKLKIKSHNISKTIRRYHWILLGHIYDDWLPWLDSKAGVLPLLALV